MNSSGTNLAKLNRGKPYNPAYMHPDAIAALGLQAGDLVTVASAARQHSQRARG